MAASPSPFRMASARAAVDEPDANRCPLVSSVTRSWSGWLPATALTSALTSTDGPTRSAITVPASMLLNWKGSPTSTSRAVGRSASRSLASIGSDTIDVSSMITRS